MLSNQVHITTRKTHMTKAIQLTERQVQVNRAIRKLQRSLRRAPTQKQVASVVGIARRTACWHIANLAEKGALTKYGKKTSVKFYDLAV